MNFKQQKDEQTQCVLSTLR